MGVSVEVRDAIRAHLDNLFVNAPATRAAWELQEELFSNCMERYEDLTRGGMSDEVALRNVIDNIGNVDDLISALPGENGMAALVEDDERRRSSAITVTIAVALYILAGVVFFVGVFVSSYLFEPGILIGMIIALIICVIPTCMLVYNAYRWPKYDKKEDTVVENFKEWTNDAQKNKALRKAVSSVLWTITVVVYLAISFATFAWWITWIIFPIAACLETIVNLAFRMKEL